jgi:pimeloyl-ACP methyl ester carboxylesterase
MTSENASPSVVLVHGAYADGSCWSEVIKRLHGAGITATAVQNPLTSLADDVAHTRRILALQPGPVVLVAHSFGGTVISEAGTHPAVAAQGRVSDTLFRDRTTVAAWRSRPAWYAVSRQDRTISPDLQRLMARRMQATTIEIEAGHLSLITHPEVVTQLIRSAVLVAA